MITNETLTAIIVIVAASMLLYYLSRNLNSPVARSSSVLLACVTVASIVDVFTFFDTTMASLETWSRVQWVGIAFAPAAIFHLSDALLATTGLVSRGRRTRVTRRLYLLSGLFVILALFSDVLVRDLVRGPAPHLEPGPVFWLFVAYYLIATGVSFYNVWRARNRCLTTYTYRRMGYLLYTFTLPSLGIFPYSLLFSGSSETSVLFWVLVNLGNLGIILMLLFMAYPLSFFGSNIPDRVVKAELLRFFLRGPAAGSLVLIIILYVPRAGQILGLPSDQFMLFAAVALVMFWQWMVSLTLPFMERHFVYPDEQDQVRLLQEINQRLLTDNDMHQLIEAILAAVCDLLQVPVAFIVENNNEQLRLLEAVGDAQPDNHWSDQDALVSQLQAYAPEDQAIMVWNDFWVVPLFSQRALENGSQQPALLGALLLQARASMPDLSPEEAQVFEVLVWQAAQALDDQRLQRQVFGVLEDLLPEMEHIQQLRDAARYGDFPTLALAQASSTEPAVRPEFVDAVRDALRDYWGGPRLTRSALLKLGIVQDALASNDNNPTRALRTVLLDAVNRLRPNGDRSMTQAEWTLYNIVELRFIQGYKVRDVARRLAMSEADLYRKQRVAIEEVARALANLEEESHIQG
ncbi:MAG: hypothetical protein JXN59_12155 [Anaerolineae bacterium]|nr:hypothetical protein [Anaerolineae bacterium]